MAQYERFEKYQKYVNGEPTDEYKQGESLGIGEYNSLEDCEQSVLYRWIDNGNTVCDGYSLYNQEKQLKSADQGLTWTDTGRVRTGTTVVEQYATECGWRLLERWNETGNTVCQGFNRAKEFIKQISYDMGATWIDIQPLEYKYEIIEYDVEECILATEPLTYEVVVTEADTKVYINTTVLAIVSGNDSYRHTTWFYAGWGDSDYVDYYDRTTTAYSHYSKNLYNPIGYWRTHTFANPGTYQIKLWGYFKDIKSIENYSESTRTPIDYSIVGWGTSNYNTEVRENYPLTVDIKNSALTSIVGDNYGAFSHITDIYINNSVITSIPLNLLQYAIEAKYIQLNDNLITEIPEGLFDNCTSAFYFKEAFKDCINLTTIPPNLFNVRGYSEDYHFIVIENTFKGCIRLESVPRLTDTPCPMMGGLFDGCTSLTNIPDNFFSNYLEILLSVIIGIYPNLNYEAIFRNTAISHIKELWITDIVSGYHEKERSFAYAFSGTNITTIPSYVWNIFKEELNIVKGSTNSPYWYINTNYMFANCSLLTDIEGEISLTNLDGCTLLGIFSNCTALVNISSIFKNVTSAFNSYLPLESTLDDGGIESSYGEEGNFNRMFLGCTSLVAVPNDLFNANLSKARFLFTFKDCINLTNYPVLNGLPIWKWEFAHYGDDPSTYTLTMAFLGCPIIYNEVPFRWGGGLLNDGSINYPTILEIVVTSETGYVSGISQSANSYTDWGDGTINTSSSHTYANPGTYQVKLYRLADYSRVYMSTSGFTITKILDLGSYQTFEALPGSVTYLGADHGAFYRQTSVSLSSSNLVEISPDLFKYGLNLNSISFRSCTNLTEIPSDLFNNCTSLTSLYRCFYECYSILSLPEGLLDNCTELIDVESMCAWSGLKTIPDSLFRQNKKITTFEDCFYYCGNLESPTPTDEDGGLLWERAGKEGYPASINSSGCFGYCTKIPNYADIPSTWK